MGLAWARSARAAAVAVAVALAATPAAAEDGSYLSDPARFEAAFGALLASAGRGRPLLSIEIEPERIVVEAQAPVRADAVDRWSVERRRFWRLRDVDAVTGPQPVVVGAVVADVESGFFRLEEVSLGALPALYEEALRRAALEEEARIASVRIARPVRVAPDLRYGALRIAVEVTSGRETASVFADPTGRVVGADLSQTRRAQRMDILADADWPAADAQAALETALAGLRVARLRATRTSVSVDAVDPARPQEKRSIGWSMAGVARSPFATPNLARGAADFAMEDVDLTRLPAILAAARAAVGDAPGSVVEAVAVAGPAGVEWRVAVAYPDAPPGPFGAPVDPDDAALARFSADGALVELRLPPRRRPARRVARTPREAAFASPRAAGKRRLPRRAGRPATSCRAGPPV